MAKILIQQNTTSKVVQVFAQNSSSTTGAGLTGLAYNTAGLTAYYYRDGDSSSTQINLVTASLGTYTSSGFIVVDGTNMPGVYQIGLPSGCFTALGEVNVYLQGATNLAPVVIECQVVAFNPNDAVHLGLTALPNTACTTNGSLITSGTGTAQLSLSSGEVLLQPTQTGVTIPTVTTVTNAVTVTGTPSVNVTEIAGQTASASGSVTFPSSVGTSTYAGGAVASVTGNVGGNVIGSVASVASTVDANVVSIDSQSALASGSVTFPSSVGTSTYAGGAVASVTGNVGGNVIGSVGSVTSTVNANVLEIDSQSALASGSVTFPSSIGTSTYSGGAVASVTGNVGGSVASVASTVDANVLEIDSQSALASGSVTFPSSVGTSTYAGGAVASVTGNVGGSVGSVLAGVTVTTNNDKTGYSLSSSGVDGITIESGLNMRQALAIVASAVAGVLSGAATTTITIEGAGAATTRIVATVDASGDRTAITLSPPA